MRQRVFTKSPVQENCTPGSVRGLSGNRQSYRDLRGSFSDSLPRSRHRRCYEKEAVNLRQTGDGTRTTCPVELSRPVF